MAALITEAADAITNAANNPFNYVTGLGFPGFIIALFMSGKLRTEKEVDRIVKESDAKDDIIKDKDKLIVKLQSGIVDQAVPALTRTAQVLENIPVTEASTLHEIALLNKELKELRDTLLNGKPTGKRQGR